MNNDLAVLESIKQIFRNSTLQFCREYNDFSTSELGELILSLLDGQLRNVKKISELQSKISTSGNDYAKYSEIREFIEKEKKPFA